MFFTEYTDMLKHTIDKIDCNEIQELYAAIEKVRNSGKRLIVLGNGGSAAAASHWVCDFGKGINTDNSKRLKIIAPSDNSAVFSALGNDFGYDTTFSEQIKNYLEPGDLVLTMSVSGNSSNLLKAHQYAREIGAETACIVGDYKGKIIDLSDLSIVIKSKNYGVVEDIHIVLCHAISQKIRKSNEVVSYSDNG